MATERRERLEKALKQHEIQKRFHHPSYMQKLDRATLDRIRELDDIREVTPHADFSLALHHGETTIGAYGTSLPPLNRNMANQIVAGANLESDDRNGILLHEMQAYRLGVVSQNDLEEFVGKPLTIEVHQQSGDPNLSRLVWAFMPREELDEAKQFKNKTAVLGAIQKLFGQLDAAELSPQQQQLLQSAMDIGNAKTEEKRSVQKQFIVRGIFHSERNDDYFSLFRSLMFQPQPSVYVHPQTGIEIQADIVGQDVFHGATVQVDGFASLEPVEKKLKEMGFRTNSARSVFRHLDREIDRVCRIFFYVALGVLGIAALGISNTLVISVMERTPEFGIMKSLGARDVHILLLMFFEGTLLGLIGAMAALGLSFALSLIGQGILRNYVEGRFGETMSGQLFTFSPFAIATSFALAVLICSLASILPAWRAAKLDPVVAMRRN